MRDQDELPPPRYLRGWSGVYVIGPKAGNPLKIGYSSKPKACIANLNAGRGDVEPLVLHQNFWVADIRIARRLEKGCHEILDKANKRTSGEWFDINVEWAEKVIRHVADREHIPLFTNADISKMIESGLIDVMAPQLSHGGATMAKSISRIVRDARGALKETLAQRKAFRHRGPKTAQPEMTAQ